MNQLKWEKRASAINQIENNPLWKKIGKNLLNQFSTSSVHENNRFQTSLEFCIDPEQNENQHSQIRKSTHYAKEQSFSIDFSVSDFYNLIPTSKVTLTQSTYQQQFQKQQIKQQFKPCKICKCCQLYYQPLFTRIKNQILLIKQENDELKAKVRDRLKTLGQQVSKMLSIGLMTDLNFQNHQNGLQIKNTQEKQIKTHQQAQKNSASLSFIDLQLPNFRKSNKLFQNTSKYSDSAEHRQASFDQNIIEKGKTNKSESLSEKCIDEFAINFERKKQRKLQDKAKQNQQFQEMRNKIEGIRGKLKKASSLSLTL